jgi:hypothetical protein
MQRPEELAEHTRIVPGADSYNRGHRAYALQFGVPLSLSPRSFRASECVCYGFQENFPNFAKTTKLPKSKACPDGVQRPQADQSMTGTKGEIINVNCLSGED